MRVERHPVADLSLPIPNSPPTRLDPNRTAGAVVPSEAPDRARPANADGAPAALSAEDLVLDVDLEGGQCSVLQIAREVGSLASHAYRPGAPLPTGFDVVHGVEGPDGFAASAYRGPVDGREQIVIAFRGSGDRQDILQNLQSGVAVPSQYRMAVEFVAYVRDNHPGEEVVLTGHSLGGGLAAYASVLKDVPAVVFNAAGPSGPHADALGPGSRGTAEFVVEVRSSSDILTQNPILDPALQTGEDLLQALPVVGHLMPDELFAGQSWSGTEYVLEDDANSRWWIEGHSMDNVNELLAEADALEARTAERGEGVYDRAKEAVREGLWSVGRSFREGWNALTGR